MNRNQLKLYHPLKRKLRLKNIPETCVKVDTHRSLASVCLIEVLSLYRFVLQKTRVKKLGLTEVDDRLIQGVQLMQVSLYFNFANLSLKNLH